MNVTFLSDAGNADGSIGGAELTMAELANSAPQHVVLCDLAEADSVVVGNYTSFGPDLIPLLDKKRVVVFHNDLSPHNNLVLKDWLDDNAEHTFCSPLHRDLYGIDGELVPPPIHLKRFKPTRQVVRNGKRYGNIALGAWQNPGKGQCLLAEWADANGKVDVYGAGPYVPHGPNLNYKGPVDQPQVPTVLWGYQRFVHLPTDPEPFGRAVVEAWAAGLQIVTNELVGALWWLREAPHRLETAAQDFWDILDG